MTNQTTSLTRQIISPAIDMIELIAARGNTSLESAVTLTKSLRWDIQELGSRVEKAVTEEQLSRRGSSKAKSRAQNDMQLKSIIADMRKLLDRIEDAVPLINLAITTSGVSLSHTLPATVSPSRLLQASTFLTSGDGQYCMKKPRAQQIGPTFILSMYMLFAGYANRAHEEGIRETTWKEVMHKARVTLLRVPLDNVYDYPTPFGSNIRRADEANHSHIPSDSRSQEYAYQLLIVEDLDDGRMHNYDDDEPCPEPYDGIEQAGLREIVPIHEISKIFYADTGKILNIGTEGETNNPILLLKRDINATPPRRTMEPVATDTGYESDESRTVGADSTDDEQSELDDQLRRESTPDLHEEVHQEAEIPNFPWRLPPTLDLEWMAFEVYTEEPCTDSEIDENEASGFDVSSPPPTETVAQRSRSRSESSDLLEDLSNLKIQSDSPQPTQNTQLIPSPQKKSVPMIRSTPLPPTSLPAIKTSLSLLEMLIRLTALQQFQQSSHLAIPDEFLTFFLSESSTSGAGGDADLRRRYRREARMRVGFDPYDESPIKRRGEEYLEHEFHDHNHNHDDDDGYDETFPVENIAYDYEGYPTTARTYSSSRSQTPARSPSIPNSTPTSSSRPSSTADLLRGSRPSLSLSHASSPSPLLRRATAQPGQSRGLKQPSFRGLSAVPRKRGTALVPETPLPRSRIETETETETET